LGKREKDTMKTKKETRKGGEKIFESEKIKNKIKK